VEAQHSAGVPRPKSTPNSDRGGTQLQECRQIRNAPARKDYDLIVTKLPRIGRLGTGAPDWGQPRSHEDLMSAEPPAVVRSRLRSPKERGPDLSPSPEVGAFFIGDRGLLVGATAGHTGIFLTVANGIHSPICGRRLPSHRAFAELRSTFANEEGTVIG